MSFLVLVLVSIFGWGNVTHASRSLSSKALPTGGMVVGGKATIKVPRAGHMNIHQRTPRAAINWKSFDVGPKAKVDIRQPNARSILLNRVTGSKLSQVAGVLTANGKVILVNPNGILFHEGSLINVNGILASTQDLDPQKFMTSRNLQLRFFNPLHNKKGAEIVIEKGAKIKVADTGMAYFVSPFVRNEGLIVAKSGQVKLLGAREVVVDFYGDDLINFVLSGPLEQGLLDNRGIINVNDGQVAMSIQTAKGVIQDAVHLGGVVRGSSMTKKGGTVRIEADEAGVIVSGRIKAQGKTEGGHVEVLTRGDIRVTEDAQVDVSGGRQGGKIYLGSKDSLDDRRLNRNDIARPLAANLTLDQGAVLKADALDQGRGGEIIAFSRGSTDSKATITARGKGTGAGGAIEVSGETSVSILGNPNPSGENGQSGVLIVDPGSFTITHDNASVFTGDTVSDTWLNTQLATSHVFLSTSSGTNNGGEKITVAADAVVEWTTDYGLALEGMAFSIFGNFSHPSGDGYLTFRVKPNSTDIDQGRAWGSGSTIQFLSGSRLNFGQQQGGYGFFRAFSGDGGLPVFHDGEVAHIKGNHLGFTWIPYKLIGGPNVSTAKAISELKAALSTNDPTITIALAQHIDFNMPGSQGYNSTKPSYTWSTPNPTYSLLYSGDDLKGNMYTISNSTKPLLKDIGSVNPGVGGDPLGIIDHLSLKNFKIKGTSEASLGALSQTLGQEIPFFIFGANLDTISIEATGNQKYVGALVGSGTYSMRHVRGLNLSIVSPISGARYVGGLSGNRSVLYMLDKNIYTTGSIQLTGSLPQNIPLNDTTINNNSRFIGGIDGSLRNIGEGTDAFGSVPDSGNLFSSMKISTDQSGIENVTVAGGIAGYFSAYRASPGYSLDMWSDGNITIGTTVYKPDNDPATLPGPGQSFGAVVEGGVVYPYDTPITTRYFINGKNLNGPNSLHDGRRNTLKTTSGEAAIDADPMFANFVRLPDTPVPETPPLPPAVITANDPGNIAATVKTTPTTVVSTTSYKPTANDLNYSLPSYKAVFESPSSSPASPVSPSSSSSFSPSSSKGSSDKGVSDTNEKTSWGEVSAKDKATPKGDSSQGKSDTPKKSYVSGKKDDRGRSDQKKDKTKDKSEESEEPDLEETKKKGKTGQADDSSENEETVKADKEGDVGLVGKDGSQTGEKTGLSVVGWGTPASTEKKDVVGDSPKKAGEEFKKKDETTAASDKSKKVDVTKVGRKRDTAEQTASSQNKSSNKTKTDTKGKVNFGAKKAEQTKDKDQGVTTNKTDKDIELGNGPGKSKTLEKDLAEGTQKSSVVSSVKSKIETLITGLVGAQKKEAPAGTVSKSAADQKPNFTPDKTETAKDKALAEAKQKALVDGKTTSEPGAPDKPEVVVGDQPTAGDTPKPISDDTSVNEVVGAPWLTGVGGAGKDVSPGGVSDRGQGSVDDGTNGATLSKGDSGNGLLTGVGGDKSDIGLDTTQPTKIQDEPVKDVSEGDQTYKVAVDDQPIAGDAPKSILDKEGDVGLVGKDASKTGEKTTEVETTKTEKPEKSSLDKGQKNDATPSTTSNRGGTRRSERQAAREARQKERAEKKAKKAEEKAAKKEQREARKAARAAQKDKKKSGSVVPTNKGDDTSQTPADDGTKGPDEATKPETPQDDGVRDTPVPPADDGTKTPNEVAKPEAPRDDGGRDTPDTPADDGTKGPDETTKPETPQDDGVRDTPDNTPADDGTKGPDETTKPETPRDDGVRDTPVPPAGGGTKGPDETTKPETPQDDGVRDTPVPPAGGGTKGPDEVAKPETPQDDGVRDTPVPPAGDGTKGPDETTRPTTPRDGGTRGSTQPTPPTVPHGKETRGTGNTPPQAPKNNGTAGTREPTGTNRPSTGTTDRRVQRDNRDRAINEFTKKRRSTETKLKKNRNSGQSQNRHGDTSEEADDSRGFFDATGQSLLRRRKREQIDPNSERTSEDIRKSGSPFEESGRSLLKKRKEELPSIRRIF